MLGAADVTFCVCLLRAAVLVAFFEYLVEPAVVVAVDGGQHGAEASLKAHDLHLGLQVLSEALQLFFNLSSLGCSCSGSLVGFLRCFLGELSILK